MPRLPFILLLSILASACASVALTPAGQNVVLMKSDPPLECEDVGTLEAVDPGNRVEGAKNKLRNMAAEMGANYVRWDSMSAYKVLTGTAFKCPANASPPATAQTIR